MAPCDVDTGPRRAGEGDLVDAWVASERAADLRAVAGDDVEDAGRKAGLVHAAGELERRHRRIVARFHDDCAAGGESGRELPREKEERRIPRYDRGDNADRFTARIDEEVRAIGRDRRAFDLVGRARKVVEPLR
jgi:hypothetical protein